MNTKLIVQDLLKHLPEDVSLQEVAHEIEFIAGVCEGFESFERGGDVTIEEARARLSEVVKGAGR